MRATKLTLISSVFFGLFMTTSLVSAGEIFTAVHPSSVNRTSESISSPTISDGGSTTEGHRPPKNSAALEKENYSGNDILNSVLNSSENTRSSLSSLREKLISDCYEPVRAAVTSQEDDNSGYVELKKTIKAETTPETSGPLTQFTPLVQAVNILTNRTIREDSVMVCSYDPKHAKAGPSEKRHLEKKWAIISLPFKRVTEHGTDTFEIQIEVGYDEIKKQASPADDSKLVLVDEIPTINFVGTPHLVQTNVKASHPEN